MILALQVLVAWLFADFVTGVFHWFEDRYLDGNSSLEFARGVATDNVLHHDRPTAMLMNTKWENMRSAAIFAWPVAFFAWEFGAPLWLWLGISCTAFGNLIHRFAHTPARQLPRWIRGMQEFGLFISRDHHATHHYTMGQRVLKADAARAYCPMSDWLNPVLDRIRFWSFAECVLGMAGINTVDKRGLA